MELKWSIQTWPAVAETSASETMQWMDGQIMYLFDSHEKALGKYLQYTL